MAGTDCLSRKKSWGDYQGKSFRVVRNGVGIVSDIPSRYAQSIFNKVFEFRVGVLESIEALPPLPLLQLESMPVLPRDTSPSERGRAAFTASGS